VLNAKTAFIWLSNSLFDPKFGIENIAKVKIIKTNLGLENDEK